MRPSRPRPRVAVASASPGGFTDRAFIGLALARLGAKIDFVSVRRPPRRRADAVVLSGGHHVGLDGEAQIARDALERELALQALEEERPVLGICRGAQLMNVALGGTLLRELPEPMRTLIPTKPITVAPDSQLADILGRSGRYRVNAINHHAVDRLGAGLRRSAVDATGVTQAIEHEAHPFFVGVQWHPEYIPYLARHLRLFEHLLRAVARRGVTVR
jgi:putative glutamine amidotransferase